MADAVSFWIVLGYAALPALGNFCGGLIAEFFRVSDKMLSLALHFAAGIVLAVVGVGLMGTALKTQVPWAIALAFALGGCAAVLLDKSIDSVRRRFGAGDSDSGGPWMIYAGVAVDLFSDGVMIGSGATISSGFALLLALGQVSADVPEGFATMASFKDLKLSRFMRIMIAASFLLPVTAGAAIGYWSVRDAPQVYKFMLLSFTAGILMTVAVEEMVMQAHRHQAGEDSAWQTIALALGFSLFVLLSAYLGEG